MRYLISCVCCGFVTLLVTNCIAGAFPYRDKYPDVQVIELADLKTGYDQGEFIIVDVRSKVEFDTIHIKQAVNIPYGTANFTTFLSRTAKKYSGKKIAVYDNGIDCIKSYKAAEDAFSFASINNVYAFDGGINAWANAYPMETLLLGSDLKKSSMQLLSEEQFARKNLDFETFRKKAASSKTIVFDLRDPIQRKKELPDVKNVLRVSVDKLVRNIIKEGHLKDKQLCIFDQVGRQTRWIMYYLVANGYTNFYFLEGGATSVLKEQDYSVSMVR